ncbi:hypothetical protein LCGC14_0146620 [marine sediment metagenome]|uniref:Uncharacterized protein n=1 Tax=marine sediment metagenome TaxID=412755 RepID=A0A0F9V007_9ZZZZ
MNPYQKVFERYVMNIPNTRDLFQHPNTYKANDGLICQLPIQSIVGKWYEEQCPGHFAKPYGQHRIWNIIEVLHEWKLGLEDVYIIIDPWGRHTRDSQMKRKMKCYPIGSGHNAAAKKDPKSSIDLKNRIHTFYLVKKELKDMAEKTFDYKVLQIPRRQTPALCRIPTSAATKLSVVANFKNKEDGELFAKYLEDLKNGIGSE